MITDNLLTEDQKNAIKIVVDAYRRGQKEIFVDGAAGTGKTSIVPFIIGELGLFGLNSVAYATFVAKAANILLRKLEKVRQGGYNVSTLHKLLYNVDFDRFGKCIFTPKSFYELEHLKLFVCDEASMIPNVFRELFMKHGGITLYIGDHHQCPPIEQEKDEYNLSTKSYIYNRLKHSPDVRLTEIHRQAKESPIIQLATNVRLNKEIIQYTNLPYQAFNKEMMICKKDYLRTLCKNHPETLLNADVILCGKNSTRHQLNTWVRKQKNLPPLPVHNDRAMCMMNTNVFTEEGYRISNGMTGTIIDPEYHHNKYVSFEFKADGVEDTVEMVSWIKCFQGHPIETEDFREARRYGMHEYGQFGAFNYGYSSSVHKYQGSECDNVLLINEEFGEFKWNKYGYHSEWFYTGITRAAKRLITTVY